MKTFSKNMVWGVTLLITAIISGCQAIPATVLMLQPSETMPAEYKIPEGKKVLVFLDDKGGVVQYEKLKYDLATKLNDELVKNKVAVETIPYEQIIELMVANPATFNKMTVSEVGRKLGADLVIHVSVDKCQINEDAPSTIWSAKLGMTVKVVNSDGVRLWPTNSKNGHIMKDIEMENKTGESQNYTQVLAGEVAMKAADKIAKMFYDSEKTFNENMKQGIEGGEFTAHW